MLDRTQLNVLRRESVQDLNELTAGAGAVGYDWYGLTQRSQFLPPWGSRDRERALRLLYRNEFNWLMTSAIAGQVKKIKATPWELSGKRNVHYFQEVFRQAEFGAGWGDFLSKVALDYFRQDVGAFIEVIAPGAADRPVTGRVTGLAHLDSLFCYPTGDPEFPVVYYSRRGGYYALHYTRVIRLVDMPDGDQLHWGIGLCALSRAVSIVYQSIYAAQYTVQKLDDRPPPGIVVASNLNEQQRNRALSTYNAEQSGDLQPPWGKTMWLYGTNHETTAKIDYTTFSQAPEGWSYQEYNNLQVNAVALALGTDVQEIWQLSGGNIGSAQQSEILHAKSIGKTYGDFLTTCERRFNDILPASIEFTFKQHDPFQATVEAQTAQLWSGFAATIANVATPDEIRQILANNVQAFADAVMDAEGHIVRLNDVDPMTDAEFAEEVTLEDNTEGAPAAPPLDETRLVEDVAARREARKARIAVEVSSKALQATRLDFESDFEDLLAAARADETTRRRFGIVLRALIARYGREALIDGKAEAGVLERELNEDEQKQFAAQLARQARYVSDFSQTLFHAGISDAEAAQKPAMWFNKTIYPFYLDGLESGNRNGMYEWVLGRTEKHCTTCLSLNGQRHRMSWYIRRGLLPKSEKLECKGFNCDCALVRTTERARGTFKAHVHEEDAHDQHSQ